MRDVTKLSLTIVQAGTVAALFLAASEVAAAAQQGSYVMESNSMLPLLRKDDRVKCVATSAASVALGDLIVYRHPKRDLHWVKMVAGLAGDTVEMRGGVSTSTARPCRGLRRHCRTA